jgi:hypothetical protein
MPLKKFQNSEKTFFGHFFRIISKSLPTRGVGKIEKVNNSSKIKNTSGKFCTHVGHDCRYALEFFGPFRKMYMATLN